MAVLKAEIEVLKKENELLMAQRKENEENEFKYDSHTLVPQEGEIGAQGRSDSRSGGWGHGRWERGTVGDAGDGWGARLAQWGLMEVGNEGLNETILFWHPKKHFMTQGVLDLLVSKLWVGSVNFIDSNTEWMRLMSSMISYFDVIIEGDAEVILMQVHMDKLE
ncbi:hypothetical protein QJS10_CPB15g00747 [Acorus calamus]|uniref:Uncharacterized protein n=1 Tax=Acorus calamus TaxID=4465 RepID=A0AAV9D5K5_ACOCL|nr:hypothetical protein QJS10_CPB15g00747 [Acorus calamus]